jgi:hypothetical protein
VAEVVRPPGEGRCLLAWCERILACPGPRAPVGDRGHLAASDSGEQASVRHCAEVREVVAQDPGQLWMDRHDPAVALGPMLELPPLTLTAVIGPVAARVRRRTS